jgi:Pyruvate/2-oxoacid:ferredoxin oxidoreductase delta subunit
LRISRQKHKLIFMNGLDSNMVMLMESKSRNVASDKVTRPVSNVKSIIRAQCTEMCPDQEFDMRVKNNLVNVLEKKFIK